MTAHYVAILDTGGISYSGRVYVGIAATEDDARDAVARTFLRASSRRASMPGDIPRTTQGVADYYGIRTYGPIEDGTAVEGD